MTPTQKWWPRSRRYGINRTQAGRTLPLRPWKPDNVLPFLYRLFWRRPGDCRGPRAGCRLGTAVHSRQAGADRCQRTTCALTLSWSPWNGGQGHVSAGGLRERRFPPRPPWDNRFLIEDAAGLEPFGRGEIWRDLAISIRFCSISSR